jgi:DNA adenine methylase
MSAVAESSDMPRPALRWFGGKWKLAPWIIAHFPRHRVYVEPYGGGASVLLRKQQSEHEVYNDLDTDIVNLFRVLRDPGQAARLVQQLELTPFARDEFELAYQFAEDPVERARRLLVRSYMGFGANAHNSELTGSMSTGFRSSTSGTRGAASMVSDWRNYPGRVPHFVRRLQSVYIENRDALELMDRHDGPDTLHYVDPPYLWETRSRGNRYDLVRRMYRHELDRGGHAELLNFLQQLRGFVILSGYPDPLYDEALAHWRRVERRAHADGARERVEVLWINPAAAAAIRAGATAGPLFGEYPA